MPENNEAALARLADLMALDPALGTPKKAEMDVLATLIEAFERKAYPIPASPLAEATKRSPGCRRG